MIKKMEEGTMESLEQSIPMQPPIPISTLIATPMRQPVQMHLETNTPLRNTAKKLTTDQMVAVIILFFLLVGIILMTLVLCGVFDRKGPTISTLTPTVTYGPNTPQPLPVTVPVTK